MSEEQKSDLVRRDFNRFPGWMGRFFEEMTRDWDFPRIPGFPAVSPVEAFHPKIDVSETDKEVLVTAEIPGATEKDVEVTLTKDSLTIHGEKKVEREEKKKNYYRMERSYGSFRRLIALPCEVDETKVEAVFQNGVLKVTLPKTAEVQKSTRKIEVKTQ